MRVRARYPNNRIPDVNLVPMMDVLMTVLTFFVILSMTLNGQQIDDIQLPEGIISGSKPGLTRQKVKPFLLGINQQGQLVHQNKIIQSAELVKVLQTYFTKRPDGIVLVLADKSLPYSKVTRTLKGLRQMGGQRVSLAVQPFEEKSQ